MKILKLLYIAFFSSVILLSGCYRTVEGSYSTNQSFTNSKACTQNKFLMKYHCSLRQVEQAAIAGNADAQYALGYMYFYGIGTIRDENAARLWIQRAASQGQPLAIKAAKILNRHNSIRTSVEPKSHPGNSKMPIAVVPRSSLSPITSSQNQASMVQYSRDENNLLNSSGNYTVQIMAASSRKAINHFVSQHPIAGFKIYQTERNGSKLYLLVYGTYINRSEALAAIHSLPTAIRRLHPWIKPMTIVKREIRQG